MHRPSPCIVVALMLGAVFLIAAGPLVRALALFGIVVATAIGVLPPASRTRAVRRLRRRMGGAGAPRLAAAALAGALTLAMPAVQPARRITYVPDAGTAAPGIVEQHGLYRPEMDALGNRYVWTADHATLVIDSLVHRPITITVELRSAARAGGPDAPVRIEVNGAEAGSVHPDPTSADFQPLSLTVTPTDWGGERTEVRLFPAPFQPGAGDTRTLGVMVRRITIDMDDAWVAMQRLRWVVWAVALLALLAAVLPLVARRSPDAATLGYAAVLAALCGAAGVVLVVVQTVRVGVIAPWAYRAWIVGAACAGTLLALVALRLPWGASRAPSIAQHVRRTLTVSLAGQRLIRRARRWGGGVAHTMDRDGPTHAQITRDLVSLFTLALAVRIVWALVVPPWQAPDEPSHFAYVAHIAEQAALPTPPFARDAPLPPEITTSAALTYLYDLSSTGARAKTPLSAALPVAGDYAQARAYTGSPPDRRSATAGVATTYPPLSYLFAALPYKLLQGAPILSRLYAVRCVSALLGALTCVAAWLFAYEIRRQRRWGWALGLCMAFMPMFVFITAVANNDAAMDLGATVLLWLLARAWRRGALTGRDALVLGALSGATMLTKPGAIPVVAVAGALALGTAFLRHREGVRPVWRWLSPLGLYASGALLVYGPWALFRYRHGGDLGVGFGALAGLVSRTRWLTHVAASDSAPAARTGAGAGMTGAALSFSQYLRYEWSRGGGYFYQLFIRMFWGDFGWLDAPMPENAFRWLLAGCAIGGIGLAIQIALQREWRRLLGIALGIIAAQAVFLFVGLDFVASFARTGRTFGLQGRYFFPVLAPILYLLLSGWHFLCRERPITLRIAPAAMLALQMIGFATILARYYGVRIG